MQVPRWHFKMLNDKIRNTAYKKAIFKAFKKNLNTVIDIGCGCGILSLFASRAPNIKNIYAIESSKTLCKIAKNVFKANKANVCLISGHSTQMSDSGVKGNLIVTEIFDAALFGEYMLDTLIHAIENLVDDHFEIIPCAATVYVTGISSQQLLKIHQVCYDFPEIMLEGKSVYINEPYAVEDLTNYNVDYLTETKPIMHINFKDVDSLKRLAKEAELHSSVMVKTVKSGSIQAIALWFDLHLNETVKLTTNPFDKNRAVCWEQAIFYLNSPKIVTENEEIEICSSVVDNKLQLFLPEVLGDETTNFPVSQDVVSFLNDQLLVSQIKEMASHFCGKTVASVMDFNPVPLFGLLMAKQGATLYCQAKCKADKALLEYLARVNQIKKMKIITYEQAFYVRELIEPLDILFLPPVATDGSADESNLGLLRVYTIKLKDTGIHLTTAVKLLFKIIYSEYLESWNRVDDKNLCGFKVAKYFKEYEATENACIDYESLQYNQLSETVCVGNLLEGCGTNTSSTFTVPLRKTGEANAILYWYQFVHFDNSIFDTRKSSHYRCAAFLFPKPVCLTENCVKVVLIQNDAYFSLQLADQN